jgi:hypothetical protein
VDVEAWIARRRWQYARTMPRWPHEYTIRHWIPGGEREFDRMVQHVRDVGTLRYWPPTGSAKEVIPHLDVDGQGYWTQGDPVGICQVINRAVIPDEDEIPGTIGNGDEMREALRIDAQRGRRLRLIKHGPGARRRPGRGRKGQAYREEDLPPGSEGTTMVMYTNGQVRVRWDDMSSTFLRPGKDEWEWLEPERAPRPATLRR